MKKPTQKNNILDKARLGKISISEAARKLNVSRKTIYIWIKNRKNNKKSFEKYILRIVVASPKSGPKKISEELKKQGYKLSTRSVWLILKKLNLNTIVNRENYIQKYRIPKKAKNKDFPIHLRLNASARKQMIEEVLNGRKEKEVLNEYRISRKSFAKWKKRYIKAQNEPINLIEALKDQHPEGSKHPRGVNEKIVRKVINVVISNPEYSSHKIASILGFIGNHGVQRILERNNLSYYELRQAYSQREKAKPEAIYARISNFVKAVWQEFIPGLAPAPPPGVQIKGFRFVSMIRPFVIASFVTSFISLGLFYWIRMLISAGTTSNLLGLVFASIAFLMGSLFFLYSFKYYLTLAIVLSFSQQEASLSINGNGNGKNGKKKGLISWILGMTGGNGNGNGNGKNHTGPVGLEPNLEHVSLKRYPYFSIQIPFYNEKNVVERAIATATNFDYKGDYEVILCDDSTDETTQIIRNYQKRYLAKREELKVVENEEEGWILTSMDVHPGVTLKHLHRTSRSGFKGGALRLALTLCNPRTEFVSIFDADFVPYPDTLELFMKYFKVQNNMSEDYKKTNVAAVAGYQWHVLNKSENWITRGVRTEYAGSYVIERSGTEIYGGMKLIHGSVYAIRKDALEEVGWDTSITEDFELTLKLYDAGYKVVYTPYIQAPAECVSTLKRLIRQRMRWAEGHSHNIRKMFKKLMFNPKLTGVEKLEFLYLSPYYLQAFFFLIGTFSWLLSETVFPARLPFWTSLWGWSLVLTNLFALPLMNAVGLFLEESEERDYLGLASFVALSYLLVPFQAYAAIKGFLESEEGPWFRTPKTGKITDIFTRGQFYRFISGILPGRSQVAPANLMVNGQKLMANSFSHQPSAISHYLALSTANNRFESFKIRPRQLKWVGNLILVLFLSSTLILTSLAPFIPQRKVSASTSGKLVTVESVMAGETKQEDEQKEIDTPVAVHFDNPGAETLEMIFHKEPRVRIKIGQKEMEVTTTETEGIGKVQPKKSIIVGNKEVRYEEIVPGIDLVYKLNSKGYEEQYILKRKTNIKGVIQRLNFKEVKVVSPRQDTFGFYDDENKEIFKFGDLYMYEEANPVNKNRDISLLLEKDIVGYKLVKKFNTESLNWLNSEDRVYPVIFDPSIVVSTNIVDADVNYGGNQQKLVYVSGAYYAFHNDGGRIAYRRCSSNCNDPGADWSSGADVYMGDGADTDNEGPAVTLDGTTIWVAWYDDTNTSGDDLNFQSINTASSDALGTSVCSGPDMGNVNLADVVSINKGTNGDFVVSYSDDPDVWEVTGVTINCDGTVVFTEVTTGSGITIADQVTSTAIGNIIHFVWQEAGTLGLRHNYFDVTTSGWGTEVGIDTANLSTSFGTAAAADGDLYVHAVNGTAATALYRCAATCTGTWTTISPAPWTGQTNVLYATITYASTENDLVLSAIMDTSEKAYFKITDEGSISYTQAYDYGFSGADLGHITSMRNVTNISETAVVLRDTADFSFATVPENLLIYLGLIPFLPAGFKYLSKRRKRIKINIQ